MEHEKELKDKEVYPQQLGLDNIYYRVERNNKGVNRCFSDLTNEEIEELTGDYGREQWKSVALHLKDCLREMI